MRYSNIEPLHERRIGSPPMRGEQASQGKPAFLRQLSLRNRHESGQSRFRSQQIVVTRVPASLTDVIADRQEMTRLVEQEVILHAGEFAGLQRKAFDGRNPCSGALA